MDFLSCELVGLNPEKFCCLEVHSAIYRELLLGGAKCLFHGIQEKLKRCPPSRLRASSRTQQVLHLEVSVEESPGSLELTLPALSSYQFVHSV